MPGLSLGLGLGLNPRKGGGFSLAAFMAAQSDGFWYDFGQTDRLFQENVGPTPADEPNEVIGLALSSRLWGGKTLAAYLAEQPELLDVASSWNGFSDAILTDQGPNEVTLASGPNDERAFCTKPIPNLVVGRAYRVSGTIETIVTKEGARLDVVLGPFDVGSAVATHSFVTTGTQDVAFVFTATATTLYLRPYVESTAAGGDQARFFNLSVKEVTRYAATQATGTLKPKFQTTGAAFDGLDDNLLTGYTAGAGANFIVAKVPVPATLPSSQMISGANEAANANRYHLGINTSGFVFGGIGTQSGATIVGSTDRRGTEVVVGVSVDGATVRLFDGDAVAYQGAQSGSPTTTVPLRIGANNAAGTATAFFGGSVRNIVVGRQFLDLATFNQIASKL